MKKISENITTLELLGSGGMGHVYKAIYKRGDFEKVVAVKELIDSSSEGINEAKILAGLSHPNISSVLDFISNENGNFLVMEFIEGVPLSKVNDLTRANINYVIYNILCALEYLKSKNIIHHDISPDNIILGKHGEVKLIDFGVSKEFQNDEKSVNLSGKIRYLDPRIVQNKSKYDFEADLFSLGVIYYELITKQKLFSGDFNEVLQDLLKFKELNEYDLEDIEGEEKSIVSKWLTFMKSERINLLSLLNFFKSQSKDTYEISLPQNQLPIDKTVVTKQRSKLGSNKKKTKFLALITVLVFISLSIVFYINKEMNKVYLTFKIQDSLIRKELQKEVFISKLETNPMYSDNLCSFMYLNLLKPTYNIYNLYKFERLDKIKVIDLISFIKNLKKISFASIYCVNNPFFKNLSNAFISKYEELSKDKNLINFNKNKSRVLFFSHFFKSPSIASIFDKKNIEYLNKLSNEYFKNWKELKFKIKNHSLNSYMATVHVNKFNDPTFCDKAYNYLKAKIFLKYVDFSVKDDSQFSINHFNNNLNIAIFEENHQIEFLGVDSYGAIVSKKDKTPLKYCVFNSTSLPTKYELKKWSGKLTF